MMQVIDANLLALGIVLVIGLLVAWWIFSRTTKPRQRSHRPDVLDEGAAPAQRNQSLIDAPSAASNVANAAASVAATGPDMMMGMGEVAAAAVVAEIQAAEQAKEAAAPPPPPAAPEPAPAPAAPETGDGADDLRQIKGVGPKLVALLHGLGITRYSQIAAWSAEDVTRIDAQLGTFAGRIERDSWIEQAKFLSAGDTAGFEGKFGKL